MGITTEYNILGLLSQVQIQRGHNIGARCYCDIPVVNVVLIGKGLENRKTGVTLAENSLVMQ